MIRAHVNIHGGTAEPPHGAPAARQPLWPRLAIAYAVLCCVAALVVSRIHPMFFMEVPAVLLLLATLSATLCFACGGQSYLHHRFSRHDFVQHNEVGGIIMGVAGTVFGVVLGFLTVVAWQQFTDARQLVAQETAAATDIWHTAIGLPYANRSRIRDDILRYSQLMVSSEWPQMRHGGIDKQADLLLMDAIAAAGTIKPGDLMQSNSQMGTLQQLNVLHDVRLRRISANAEGISAFEWLILSIGGVCVIGFCWLFGIANPRIHLVMTAIVTVLLTSLLVLLFELQFPFRTDLRITAANWVGAVNHIHAMQAGSLMDMRM